MVSEVVPIACPRCRRSAPATGPRIRFLEFFAANIRNPHTRWAYYRAPRNF